MNFNFVFLARMIFVLAGLVVIHRAYHEIAKARNGKYEEKAVFYEKIAEAAIAALCGLVFIVIGLFS